MSSETAANATPATEQGPRIHLGNLSFETKYETIQEKASALGVKPKSVEIPVRKSGRPSGFAFLHFDTAEEVSDAAEKLKDLEVDGRKLRVSAARTAEEQAAVTEKKNAAREGAAKKREAKKTPRRRQPGQDSEAEGETTAIEESPAKAEKLKPKKRNSKAKKTPKEARIDGDETAATETVAAQPVVPKDEVEKVKEKREPKPRHPRFELTGEQSPNTIFVANLPFDVNDEALASVFTNLSIKVKSAKVVVGIRRNRSGRPFRASRGFGFVEIEDASQQKEAVEKVEGTLIGDRKISAKVANELRPIEQAQVNDAVKEEAAAGTEAEATA